MLLRTRPCPSFLTHTVQMKLVYNHHQSTLHILLNPHGSDETIKERPVFSEWNTFLTHTVQMKHIEFELTADLLKTS